MDVIHFLVASQKVLLNELKEIGSGASRAELYDNIKKYISNFDLSEQVEESLFSTAAHIRDEAFLAGFKEGCRQGNEKIWSLFEPLVEAALHKDALAFEKAYQELRSYAETLFEQKRILFPVLQAWLSRATLERLGNRAVHDYAQYHERLEKVESVQTYATQTALASNFRLSEPFAAAS